MSMIKVTAMLEVEDHLVDRDHESGLTQEGFDEVMGMLRGFDDIETELVE